MTTRAFAFANLIGGDNKISLEALPDEATGGGDTLGTVNGSNIDLSTGNFFEVTANDQTLGFSNVPNVKDFKIKLTGAGTVSGYVISAARFDSFRVSSQESSPLGLTFNNNGTKMYIAGGTDTIYQYSLSTAFDLSTASYDSISFSVTPQGYDPTDITFNTDGAKMYVLDFATSTIYQYSLSTAFDLSTASYDNVSFSVTSQESSPHGLTFNNNGTKMFMIGSTDSVYQYTLSTAYDISSASYDNVSFSVTPQSYDPTDITFNTDGTKMYIVGRDTDTIYQYSLSTAFDLSTTSYDSIGFSVASQEATPTDITFNADGTKMYMVGNTGDSVYQYSLSTGFDLSTASYDSASFRVSSQEAAPAGAVFSTDGTKMFIVGGGSDAVHQYTMTTAFDVSTASYDSVSFSVSAQDTLPSDLTFSPDGTKMFMVGNSSDSIHQYTLTTGFDLSTASYDSVSFSVSAQESSPTGLAFNTDGTKMFIVGSSVRRAQQYTLTSAFDVSTASYDSVSLDLSVQDAAPMGLDFTADGTKMFFVGSVTDSVHQYTMTTAFDLSTASYDGVSFSVARQEITPLGFAFSPDGHSMLVCGNATDTVYQYDTVSTTLATITYPNSVKFSSGTKPTDPAIGETDTLGFYTVDGGTTYYAYQLGDDHG